MSVGTVAIVGVGLIGGSLARAWREAGFAQHIVGVETDADAAATALDAGLVDVIASVVPDEAELVAVCTSSDQIAQQVAGLAHHAGVVFDVGSVKNPILADLTDRLGSVPARFVPCHPIAGSEQSGPRAARADLFANATTVITPNDDTDAHALTLVQSAWRAAGAKVLELTPEEHDQTLAVTSHLPHLLAFAFMQQVDADHLPYTGGGYRDFTRIAGANPELWWRILRMNKDAVLAAAQTFTADLQALRDCLVDDDIDAGLAALRKAADARRDPESDV
jgi:3-phosphoshikimate 1-carboxyvinyltransferase